MAFDLPTVGTFKELPTENLVMYDIEADSLNPKKIWCFVAYDVDEGELYKFYPEEFVDFQAPYTHQVKKCLTESKAYSKFLDFFKQRQDKIWIGHNIIGYDNPAVERILLKDTEMKFRKYLDTVILSRLFRFQSPFKNLIPYFEQKGIDTRVGGHSLEAWGKRLGLHKGDFDSDKFEHGFSLEMLDYCVQDVRVTYAIYKVLCKEQKNYRFSYESIVNEQRAAEVLQKQQEHGMQLDFKQCDELERVTENLLEEYYNEVQKLFPPKRKDLRTITPRTNKTTGQMHGTDARTLINNLHEDNGDGTFTLYEMVTFNPNSTTQKVERFMDLGWEPTQFTEKGNPTTRKDVMQQIVDELAPYHPEMEVFRKYTIVQDRNQKAKKWKELAEETGKMHGTCFHIGAWTHRCSHINDNMANVAKVKQKEVKDIGCSVNNLSQFDVIEEGPYKGHIFNKAIDAKKGHCEIILTGFDGNFGWECRNSWTVTDRNNYVMIGCDAAGIQLRALGHYLYQFDGGDYAREVVEGDIHVVNQQAAKIIDRPTAKTFIYAWLLGAGDLKIGSIVGVTPKEVESFKKQTSLKASKLKAFEYQNIKPTEQMVWDAMKGHYTKKQFLENLPALKEFKEGVLPEAADKGYMEGLDGRKIHVPSKHLAMGAYLQGFEATIMKYAMVLYNREAKACGLYCKQLNFVHDEFCVQARIEEAEEMGRLMSWSIKQAGIDLGSTCPLEGDFIIGPSWAYVH